MQGPPYRSQQQSPPHFHHHPRGHPHAPQTAQPAKPTKTYNPRHPERTLLYRTVAEHFETWLELASAGQFDGQGDHHTPPAYVEKAFRKYLECGIFAHGFGVCPSCNTRGMAEAAAHLTDHVFPRLPVRQWVLSVPKRIRYYLQRDKGALNAALRIFLRVVQQSLQVHCPTAAASRSMPGCFSKLPTALGWSAGCATAHGPHLPWTGSSNAVLICSTAAAKATPSPCSPTNTPVNWCSRLWS